MAQPLDKVVIATAPDRAAGEVLVEILAAAGIAAEIAAQPQDVYFGGMPGVDVRVAGADEARARDVIAASDRDADEAAHVEERRPERVDATVMSPYDRRRQKMALALVTVLPLPLSCYYARANRIGHALMLTYLASFVAARYVGPVALFLAIACKGLDAWLGPVLLAQRQRRHNPPLAWAALVIAVCVGAAYSLQSSVARDRGEQRAVDLVNELAVPLKRGEVLVLPEFPSTPEGKLAAVWAAHLRTQNTRAAAMAAIEASGIRTVADLDRYEESFRAIKADDATLFDRMLAQATDDRAKAFLYALRPDTATWSKEDVAAIEDKIAAMRTQLAAEVR